MDLNSIGRMLAAAGFFLLLAGLFLLLAGKVLPQGRLPGDIFWQKGNFTFFFPLATSLLLSLVLTLLLNLFRR